MLYIDGHGDREAIEVFDVERAAGPLDFTWVGYVMMPEGLDANGVASDNNGSQRFTVLIHRGDTFNDVLGEKTGAIYAWSP